MAINDKYRARVSPVDLDVNRAASPSQDLHLGHGGEAAGAASGQTPALLEFFNSTLKSSFMRDMLVTQDRE